MKQISIMIKPASSLCNMRCRYCFYSDISDIREIRSFGIMTEETAECLIDRALEVAENSVSFVFQGGEPTLAGLDFFRRFTKYADAHKAKGIKLHYSLQTNGLLITEEWAKFFRENHFLIGVSVDGSKENHDFFRPDAKGEGTYKRIRRAVEFLKKAGVEYNILTVLTAQTARRGASIYAFYRKHGWDYMQFIPCLDPYREERGKQKYSLTPKKYADFLMTTFDLWYRDMKEGNRCSIRFFDNILGMMWGVPPESCQQAGQCVSQLVAEADGSVYACDFYVMEPYCLGNLKDQDIPSLLSSHAALKFNRESAVLPQECRNCEWLRYCRGGCRRDRDLHGNMGKNYYCEAFQEFFRYSIPRFMELAALQRNSVTKSVYWYIDKNN